METLRKYSLLLLCLLSFGLVGCDSEGISSGGSGGSGSGSGSGSGGSGKTMSPMEAKNKMESAGITFTNAIKADTHQNLVDVVAFLDEDLAYYDIDEDYYEKLEALIQESGNEDYSRKVNPVKSMVGLTKLCVDAAQKGAQLSTRAADVYTLTLKAGLKDLYGKFTPDSYNEEWKYESASDRLEVAFTDDKGQKWVATLKGSSATTRVKLAISDKGTDHSYYVNGPSSGSTSYNSEWNDQYNISIDVPKEITFVVKCGSTTVIDLRVNSSLAFELDGNMESEGTHYYYWEDYYGYYYCNGDTYDYTYTFDVNYSNLNLDAKMAVNGYEETFKTDVTKSEISASAGIKIDGKSMLTANANIKANIDAIIDDASEERFKSRNIEKFSMKFDLLGEVQVEAECPNFKNLYDAAIYLDEADDIDAANQWLAEVNKAYTVKLCFDNTSATQATIEMEVAEEREEWYSYFYVYPVIVFASNDSRYSLDEYFTESAFSDLIDTVEDLIEDFEDQYDY